MMRSASIFVEQLPSRTDLGGINTNLKWYREAKKRKKIKDRLLLSYTSSMEPKGNQEVDMLSQVTQKFAQFAVVG